MVNPASHTRFLTVPEVGIPIQALLAQIAVAKFKDHVTMYRQS